MRVLLSAYACEPGSGSEPAVGWHWALEIARRDHQVWVLTRANNRPAIERELTALPTMPKLHFLYYDLPRWARWWKGSGASVHLYYLLWQWGALRVARAAHAAESFDMVHHLTFTSLRQPSFMGRLGIPFVFGPAGGGEQAPWRLLAGIGRRGMLAEALRWLANRSAPFNPIMRAVFRRARRIYVTSAQSKRLVPASCHAKVEVRLAVGNAGAFDDIDPAPPWERPAAKRFMILHVGRMIPWKGAHLGLAAFAELVKTGTEAGLTLAGQGYFRARLRQLASKLGVADLVEWPLWQRSQPLRRLAERYRSHDVLLFPSLHDSGGMVVVEALAHGLPVVCLDIGGPAALVDDSCGRVIAATGRDRSDVVAELARALEQQCGDAELRARLSAGAVRRAAALRWDRQVAAVYSSLESGLGSADEEPLPRPRQRAG
jgi:glycosyltransferase involved in cell wall biosynthesis